MTTPKQKQAARENIKKAQATWKAMTPRQRALRQPQGRGRARPGSSGKGNYYHVVVRPRSQFVSFRVQDVGRKGHTMRVAGHRSSGSWATHKWLISKEDAHMEDEILVGDSYGVKKLLDTLGSVPIHVRGDIFRARPRRNIPEKDKPTQKQRLARMRNLARARLIRSVGFDERKIQRDVIY